MADLGLSISALIARRILRAEAAVAEVSKQIGPEGPRGYDGQNGHDGIDGQNGRDGIDGQNGRDGIDGQNGRDGIDGQNGRDGIDGQQGAAGPQGEKGDQGPQGEAGPAPAHEWQGTKLRFKRPDGKWGKLTDLKGEKGEGGGTVIVARSGGSSSTGGMGSLLPGSPDTEPTGIAVVQGGQWVNLGWPAFIQIIAGAVDMGVELSRRSDFVGENIIYRGEAAPGSSESASVWRIKRITFTVGVDGKQDIDEKWAGGSAEFTNAWSDRASLGYE